MNMSNFPAQYPTYEEYPDRIRASCTVIRSRIINLVFRENGNFLMQSPIQRFLLFTGNRTTLTGVLPGDSSSYPVTQQQWIILMNSG